MTFRANPGHHASSQIGPVVRLLEEGSAEYFGEQNVVIEIQEVETRLSSEVFRAAAVSATQTTPIYIKILSPRPTGPGWDVLAARVRKDHEVSTEVREQLGAHPGFTTIRPIACFPQYLALVTEAEDGATLFDFVGHNAAWGATDVELQNLCSTAGSVGRWVRLFQASDSQGGSFSLVELERYIDVRLKRLVNTRRARFSERDRRSVLEFCEGLARMVDSLDQRETVVHGDLALGNIIVSTSGIAVLDFVMVGRGSILQDVSRVCFQLGLFEAKPQYRAKVIRAAQDSLLHGFRAGLTQDQPLFQLMMMMHTINHLSTLSTRPAAVPASVYNRYLRLRHRRWIRSRMRSDWISNRDESISSAQKTPESGIHGSRT